MQNIWTFAILATLLVCGISAKESNFRRPTKVTTSCCELVSKARFSFNVTDYRRQNALGPCVEAVIFYTDGGQVCSDPRARWVQKKIKEMELIR
ncbi:hypothetical protein AAFF_G00206690 [Aldrovandia affinis]|uniref:Chemokine interleukin-8-like domain-containing protein n=1 Tax=Aldrovandia affinis TaxID=143900 RepID=A0AAD7W5B7_9TELE|nr:hypothetical protein AAFF_G00206690 [Aldrovandia affinis]